MKKINEWLKKCKISKNKKIVITIILIIVILVSIFILMKNSNIIENARIKTAKETEELINLNVDIKESTDTSYKCLLTFTSSDENDKIKSIEYPAEKNKEKNIIKVQDEEGKQKIVIDYEIEKGNEDIKFKVTTTQGNTEEERTGYTITYKNDKETFLIEKQLKGLKLAITNLSPTKEGKHFIGYSKDKNSIVADYFEDGKYSETDKDTELYAIYIDAENGKKESINNDSLIGEVSKINTSGVQDITVNGVTYSANIIVENNDLVLDGEKQVTGATLANKIYEFGDNTQDVATSNDYAKNMVILKVNGNLTVDSNVTLTACKSDDGYGGPKGLFIYCSGTLSNNGIIDMTARGAKAEGQDVYLWENEDNEFEYVPATGGNGGGEETGTSYRGLYIGNVSGEKGTDRKTGGGGSGYAMAWKSTSLTSPRGGNGTSYSGGSGAGSYMRWSSGYTQKALSLMQGSDDGGNGR